VTSAANGAGQGPNAAGASAAVADVDATTEAYIDRNATITQAGSITLLATFDGDVTTTATATERGATAISNNLQQLLANNGAATAAGNVSGRLRRRASSGFPLPLRSGSSLRATAPEPTIPLGSALAWPSTSSIRSMKRTWPAHPA
jgi:hypothetical protein